LKLPALLFIIVHAAQSENAKLRQRPAEPCSSSTEVGGSHGKRKYGNLIGQNGPI
jgi:hypothetical protein